MEYDEDDDMDDAYCSECGAYLDGAVYESPLTRWAVCYDCYCDELDEDDNG
jgi:hypothetical protein